MIARPAWTVRLNARWVRIPGNLRGGLWMLLGGLGFSVALAIAKQLTSEIHSFELNFFRCLFGLAALAPMFLRGGPSIVRSDCWHLHLGRGLFGGVGQICVYFALTYLPLAVVTAVTYTRPLWLVVLAVLFLGESVRWRRWTAIAVGFMGVLIVARPSLEGLGFPLAVLVFSTLCHSSAHVFLKKATAVDRPTTIVFYYLVISTLVGAVPTVFVWVTPTPEQFGWLALTGVLYVAGQGFITLGFRAGEATAITPFDYVRLLYAIAFDIVLFSHYPDVWTIVGSIVIVGSTLYIARRHARLRQAPDAPGPGGGRGPA
ncbi:MAG: DMT family transporter [Alphaproteobacteria bacterium]|nr:DMT family transporter [Alphaproteobacteria bacterium]